jgi:hypothetical protein
MNSTTVNPPGFDMRNALSVDDIIWPITGMFDQANVWGRMIVEDRKASVSTARAMNDMAVGYGIAVSRAQRIIHTAINGDFDQDIYQVY